MAFDDGFEADGPFVQIEVEGQKYERINHDNLAWEYEVQGNPDKPLVVQVMGYNAPGWACPGVNFLTSYKWDREIPEVSMGRRKLFTQLKPIQ